jgi:N-methylhydantoinase A
LDVGGTFTDLFLIDDATGESVRHKLSSTPADPYRAPIQGIREILALAKRQPSEVAFVGLGTTVATNALLERKVARTGLLTTKGFRDLLEIGRQRRPHVYNQFARRPDPLVPRELRFEIEERIAADGSVLVPLNEASVERAVQHLRVAGCTSVALCFLNSYANAEHERRAAEIVRRLWPELSASISSELLPEFREYERLSSTVINAALMPVMQNYLHRFRTAVRELGVPAAPWIMSSGGGVATPELAASRPIDTLLSGPSGGVSGSLHIGRGADVANLITFDMGGTSTDVCLIRDGRPEITQSRQIDGLPIKSPAVDVHTVGAGGSSVAWVDAGGLLRVGPRSAGANPGPACYGIGGLEPTVTDANVVLGRLNQTHLLRGALKIDMRRSVEAIERVVAGPKGLSLHDAAAAMIAISNTNIAQAIRFVSVERGLDPADFMLIAFGGAGPLHAAEVARELRMRVLVPPSPGVLCAMGVLTKDVQVDLGQTRLLRLSAAGTAGGAGEVFAALAQRAQALLGVDARLSLEYSVDARYVGQNFELPVVLPAGPADLAPAVRAGFDAEHRRLYGYDQPEKEIEIVTLRLRASVPARTALPKEAPSAARGEAPLAVGKRRVHFADHGGFVECPIYERESLQPAHLLRGPLIVEQMDTTTVVPPDWVCSVDRRLNLILDPVSAPR